MEKNNPNGQAGSDDHSDAGSKEGKDDKSSVSYETHQTLLTQRKQDQAKLKDLETELNSFREAEKKRAEEKLASEGNYKALLDSREQEIKTLKEEVTSLTGKIGSYEETFVETKKFNALFKELGATLKHKDYYHLVDLNKIAIDPETKEVDAKTLKAFAADFVKEHKELLNFGTGKMPGGAPQAASSISYDEWLKLAKTNPAEARKRQKDIK